MNVLQNFDLLQFVSEEKIHIENRDIEKCKISGIKNKVVIFCKSNFKKVVFENFFYEVYASFKECEFTECVFRDTFEGDDLELVIKDCIFSVC